MEETPSPEVKSLKKPLLLLCAAGCVVLGLLSMAIAGAVLTAKHGADGASLALLVIGGLPFAAVFTVVTWNAIYFFCCCDCWKERYREITL